MTIALRDYQDDLLSCVRKAMVFGQRRVLLVAPCGSGKTVIFSWLARQVAARDKRILILTHRREILDQISISLLRMDVAHEVGTKREHPTRVCTIQSLARGIQRIEPPDLIIIDESQHCLARTWSDVIATFPHALVLGVTATPWRMSGHGLGSIFDVLVPGPSVSWLMERGYLSRYRVFTPPSPDLTHLHTRGGDFVVEESEEAVDKPAIIGDVVEHYRRVAPGTKAICYCVSRRHSEHVAESFRQAGIAASHVDGDTPKAQRKLIIRDFADGLIDVLTNVEICTEGLDLSALAGKDVPIETVILLRPTKSLTLHLQTIGRALRPKASPAVILDHVGNIERAIKLHGGGFPDDEFGWTLADRKIRTKAEQVAMPAMRVCPNCFACYRPQPKCPECGYSTTVEGRMIDHQDGELLEVDLEAARKIRKQQQGRATDLAALMEIGKQRGYKSPYFWAQNVLKARAAKKSKQAV